MDYFRLRGQVNVSLTEHLNSQLCFTKFPQYVVTFEAVKH